MAAGTYRVEKVDNLPALPTTADTIFLLKSATTGFFDFYLSSADGSAYRHTITRDEVQGLISSQLAAAQNSFVVADIAARNALAPTHVTMAFVIDASAAPEVTAGSAQFIYNPTTTTWYLVAEYESQIGPNVDWSIISGGPSSTPSLIDDAVTKRHTHANKTDLDRLAVNASGHPTVDGNPVLPWMSRKDW